MPKLTTFSFSIFYNVYMFNEKEEEIPAGKVQRAHKAIYKAEICKLLSTKMALENEVFNPPRNSGSYEKKRKCFE